VAISPWRLKRTSPSLIAVLRCIAALKNAFAA
jgi:hypothetical protein